MERCPLHANRLQSTHSKRSATPAISKRFGHNFYFNPRTPSGVRQDTRRSNASGNNTSIHALQAECDIALTEREAARQILQSTHSKRSATLMVNSLTEQQEHFNPRTPSGVRPNYPCRQIRPCQLQSTHSKRSATQMHNVHP